MRKLCSSDPTGLTRKEAALLRMLREHAGACLSREFLLRAIWGYQQGVRSRTVDVHVARLRKKLGAPVKDRIRTVLRAGYCWLAEVPERPLPQPIGAGPYGSGPGEGGGLRRLPPS